MTTLKQQINALIEGLPTDGLVKVKVEELQEIFNKLNDKSEFNGEYSQLSDIPQTIEHSNNYRARTFLFSEEEEKLIQNDSIWHSGAQILAHRPTTMNIVIHPSELKEHFETFIDQIGEGAVNLVNAEPGDFEFMLPDGKLSQTENRMDAISILVWKNKIIVKGDLKDA